VFSDLFKRREPRKFHFTPYYYQEEKEDPEYREGSRIKFQRLSNSAPVPRKSLRGMVMLLVLVILMLGYFWITAGDRMRSYDMDDIRIESATES
jgi:hypothetical protein